MKDFPIPPAILAPYVPTGADRDPRQDKAGPLSRSRVAWMIRNIDKGDNRVRLNAALEELRDEITEYLESQTT